jgi:APA family basic amino acid/polyamine antiporter
MVGRMLGPGFRELASNCLTAAVCFGPVAVAYTAAGFLKAVLPEVPTVIWAVAMLLVCYALVASGTTAMGRLVLVLSSVTALVLIGGSALTIAAEGCVALPTALPDFGETGRTLLVLFWAIIGWEMIGNYIEDVRDPKRTVMRAMRIGVAAVVFVYLVTALALQTHFSAHGGNAELTPLLAPLMGGHTGILFTTLAVGFCLCTLVSVLGAVTRQLRARSEAGLLPPFLGRKYAGMGLLALAHALVLIAAEMGFLTVEGIVAVANTFFIGNALLGLLAALKFFEKKALKAGVAVLGGMLALLLAFSNPLALVALAAISAFTLTRSRRAVRRAQPACGADPLT